MSLIALLWADGARSTEACVGDCDGNGGVMINDLVLGVRIALRELPVDECRGLDVNSNEHVTIDELVLAVSSALTGCIPVPVTETPTLTPLSCPPQTPQVDPLATDVGDPVIIVTGSVAIERDGSSLFLCGERGCLDTAPLSGHTRHSFSIAMLLRENRVNRLSVCAQDPECGSTACAETDSEGAPLTVRQVPCLSASCTPTPTATPTCGSVVYEFCDNGHRGGMCGPCCFCEATVTATATSPNASPPSDTPTATATPTRPVCMSQACPDLQPVAAQDFLPGFEGPCVTDWREILPYLANVCIANDGDAPAGPFTVMTSAPANFDSRFFQPVFDVSGLDVGAQLCRLVLLPYFDLDVDVDSANHVLERDESNNRQHYPLPVPTAPRFCTVTPTSTPSTVRSVQPTPTPNSSGCTLQIGPRSFDFRDVPVDPRGPARGVRLIAIEQDSTATQAITVGLSFDPSPPFFDVGVNGLLARTSFPLEPETVDDHPIACVPTRAGRVEGILTVRATNCPTILIPLTCNGIVTLTPTPIVHPTATAGSTPTPTPDPLLEAIRAPWESACSPFSIGAYAYGGRIENGFAFHCERSAGHGNASEVRRYPSASDAAAAFAARSIGFDPLLLDNGLPAASDISPYSPRQGLGGRQVIVLWQLECWVTTVRSYDDTDFSIAPDAIALSRAILASAGDPLRADCGAGQAASH